MSTIPIGSYRFSQKIHPLSLLAQLLSRRATGCLQVFKGSVSWSIYLEEGKLTYASYSADAFERLDRHLRRLSQQIPTLHSAIRVQVQLLFETGNEGQGTSNADYQAICWLVNQQYLTPEQAAMLIEELAKEVLEPFLLLKEGSHEFTPHSCLDKLPKFCRLELRSLVEHCQKQLREKRSTLLTVATPELSNVFPQVDLAPQAELEQPGVGANNVNAAGETNSYSGQSSDKPLNKSLYTIACIDDSPTVLNSIKSFLDERNFTVIAISDPVKALMQISRSKPDLILLDITMPNLDGYELCSLLRRHSAFKNTPIIMVTGKTGFIDRAKAKLVRSSGYLTKPFTQSDLLKIVFKHLT